MPVIFRYGGYRFFYYSNEGNPLERPRIHVRRTENIAKFWLDPFITLCESYGFNSSELTEIVKTFVRI